MTRTEQDKMIAERRVIMKLVSEELEGTVKSKSDLRRYLFMLEYNNIHYKLRQYFVDGLIYVMTDYTKVVFDCQGNQYFIEIH